MTSTEGADQMNRRAGLGVAALLLSACNPVGQASTPLPAGVDLQGIAEEALTATMPDGPVQITFDFRLRESDLRFSGQGVARVQPPYRLRIDLFTNQGESLFRAALVGSDLRIPPGVPLGLAPPPALLWAALGVFRPDANLHLAGGRELQDGQISARYGGDRGEDLRFQFRRGLLTRAEIHEEGHLIEEVDLELDQETGDVVETVYRNHAMFLELTFTLNSVESVESFPSNIWDPGH